VSDSPVPTAPDATSVPPLIYTLPYPKPKLDTKLDNITGGIATLLWSLAFGAAMVAGFLMLGAGTPGEATFALSVAAIPYMGARAWDGIRKA